MLTTIDVRFGLFNQRQEVDQMTIGGVRRLFSFGKLVGSKLTQEIVQIITFGWNEADQRFIRQTCQQRQCCSRDLSGSFPVKAAPEHCESHQYIAFFSGQQLPRLIKDST